MSSKLWELLDRPIAFQRRFVSLTGSVTAALFLSQAIYWQKRAKQPDGWWYKSATEWEEETGLSRYEQVTARRKCEPYLTSDLRGVPATLHWKVDEHALETALLDNGLQTSFGESSKLVVDKPANYNKESETTTENGAAAPRPTGPPHSADEARERVRAALARSNGGSQFGWLPEHVRPLAEGFAATTGITPTRAERGLWQKGLAQLAEADVTPEGVKAAVAKMRRDGLTIKSPLSVLAVARDAAHDPEDDDEYWSEVHY